MIKLEVMYIVRPELDDLKMLEKVADIIEQSGGTVAKKEVWGKKRLAYEIDGCNTGRYCWIKFDADDAVATAERVKNALEESREVLSHMIIKQG